MLSSWCKFTRYTWNFSGVVNTEQKSVGQVSVTSCTLTASFAIIANAASVTVVRIQVLLVLLALLALLVACIASISRVDCRHYWWNTWHIGIKRQLRILLMNIQFEIPVVNTLLPPLADFSCHRQLKEDEIPLDFLPCEFVQGLRAKRLEWQVQCSSAPFQYKRLLLL